MGTVLISTPGDVSLDPSFGAAIYENLLQELAKTKQFKQVFRSSDRNANDVPGLLILKTTVQTRRRRNGGTMCPGNGSTVCLLGLPVNLSPRWRAPGHLYPWHRHGTCSRDQ